MPDLESRLRSLRFESAPVTDIEVAGDLRRARRAVTHRRAIRVTTGAASVAAIGLVAGVIVANQPDHAARDVSQPTQHSRPSTGTQASSGPRAGKAVPIRLVDYTGAQQPGFTVTKVPEGFVLQGATSYSLDVARADDHSSVDVFSDKVVVMLQSQSASFDRTGDPVQVHGTTGYVRDEPGVATSLEYMDGDHDVVVQAWDSLGLSRDQLVEFANGVTVTSAAQAGVG